MMMFTRRQVSAGLSILVLGLSACSGDDPVGDAAAGANTEPAAGDDGPPAETPVAQAPQGESCWEAEITGALNVTIGDCDHFVTSWSPFEGSDLIQMNLRTSSSVLTLVDTHFPPSIMTGGTYDIAEDLGPGTSVGVDGTNFSGVAGTLKIDGQAADESISGSFTIMAESSSTGDTITATGFFTAIPPR